MEETPQRRDGKIIERDIDKEMRTAYIDYAMSVIVSRALPDARDGLKPVHRRILYAMHEDGITSDKAYRKCANTVGSVLGRYHPHGDSSVYDAMVRLAQDFTMRYPLVDGHGNFGSVDGDSPAAMRYTEARMSKISELMLTDIEKNTVDFMPNYDDRLQEPTVLPARIPALLVNGSSGIAVGMATNIPPHNLSEVIDGIVVNDKCRTLAKKIKEIIDLKSSFADWLNNQNVRDQLKYDIKVCLIRNKYPPQYSPEVFTKVMEQVENFKANS